ncbi:uncharacterized protein LOC144654408 [Oculina patagonica]
MVGHEHKRRLTIQILISVTVALLEWIHAINATTADQNQREAMFYSVKSASLIGKVTMTRLVRDEVECATLCYRQYPHNCLSFNFGGISIDDTHICELSNSERALEPQRMQRRKGFDYYGMQKVYLSRYFPCLAFPCGNGGSCVHGPVLETFACSCLLEIRVLPYIDNKCSVDHSLIGMGSPVKNVFYSKVGKKQLNYYEAERLCNILGATLASLEQLTVAFEAGLYRCEYAWLVDATVRYPMQTVNPNCGNMIGVVGSDAKRNKETGQYDAWCYKG